MMSHVTQLSVRKRNYKIMNLLGFHWIFRVFITWHKSGINRIVTIVVAQTDFILCQKY